MHESWQANYNDIKGEIERFEQMENGQKTFYFDVHTIENIFDFYTDKFQFEKAEKALQIGIRQHPDATSLQAKHAIILMEKGEDDRAIKLMESLLQLEQSNQEIFLNLGLAYLRNNQQEKAVVFFKKALETAFEDREDVMLDIGIYLNQHEAYKITIDFLASGCREFPNNESLLFELAFAYDKEFIIEKGLETYNRLIDINPFSENAWYNLGILYIKNNDFDNANKCYDYALAINPAHGEALFNKGNSLVNQGQYLEAIDCYIDYISYGYDVLLPYHYIADCLDQLGNWDLALRFYRLTVNTDTGYMPAWLGYLALLINQEYASEASEVSEKALQYHGEISELWYLRARSLLLTGNLNEAEDAFEVCFKEDYDNLRNAYELYQLKKALSPKFKGDKLLNRWLKAYPDSPAVHYLATAYYLLDERNLNKAIGHLRTALIENPEDYEFFVELFPTIEKMVSKSKKLTQLIENYFPYEF
ncbi:tetratricopeptide repeat protein [Alkaliflexus imshenetskii]|uniref:tetratricopeptide repeat protein n=1 Tax=Alkaliflexus imshenetskii TaxID=286730 RepID=UPI00047A740C|nr:tetratricopeptide repeat protein [Alkaliflexus imshenetskii]